MIRYPRPGSMLLLAATAIAGLTIPTESSAQTLRGSPESVERVYRQAIEHGLHFFETGDRVRHDAERGALVRLDGNADYRVHNVRYPYALPITAVFVERLARQYRSACGEQLVVTSAMRPRSFRLSNSVDRSVHPTGMAIDLRRPSNPRCLTWLRRTLLSLERQQVIEAVEERRPPHFHVTVFPAPYLAHVRRLSGEQVLAHAVPRPDTIRYEVRRGDTLWSIARRHDTTVDALQTANRLSGTHIMAGQTLVVPTAR